MRKLVDFLKRIKVDESNTISNIDNSDNQEIEIHIEGDFNLFKNEKEKIIQGAKEFLQNGMAKDMEDAIITCAVMVRGLKYSKTEKTEDGKTVIVLKETIQQLER